MKKQLLLVSLLTAGLGVCAVPASAQLLGVDPGIPRGNVNGDIRYSAPYDPSLPGTLIVSASPTTMEWATAGAFASGSFEYGSSLWVEVRVDVQGALVGGADGPDFSLAGTIKERDPKSGLLLATYAGVLLTGEVTEFGFSRSYAGLVDAVDMRIAITGGQMAQRLGGGTIGLRVVLLRYYGDVSGFDADFNDAAAGSFGPVCGGRIGDYVWSDTNRNGLQDASDAPFSNLSLTLTNLLTSETKTATTDQNGNYSFGGLCAGNYRVTLTPPPKYGITKKCSSDVQSPDYVAGCSAETDTNSNPADVTLLSSGAETSSVDFGLVQQLHTLAGRVWRDDNGNGVQEAAEPGMPNLRIRMTTPDFLTKYATTGANGEYAFTGLLGGAYRICVAPAPAGAIPSYDLDFPSTANCARLTLTGTSRSDVDFGYVIFGSITGRVWNDANSDGIQADTESGFGAWAVVLKRPDGTIAVTATTQSDGSYLLDKLPSDQFSVCVQPPDTYRETFDPDYPATPDCAPVALSPAQARSGIDFGYQLAAQIGDRVWHDIDGDGVQDGTEPGLTGLAITLSGPVTATTVTGDNGAYTFGHLAPGTYTVCVTPPANMMRQTFGPGNRTTPNCGTATVAAGNIRNDVDFGYQLYVSIGERVWDDRNGNGRQDAGEPGLANVEVVLTLPDGSITSTTTGITGMYLVEQLPPGQYTVCVEPPNNVAPTYDLDGTGTPNCAHFPAKSGVQRRNVNFGYRDLPAPEHR